MKKVIQFILVMFSACCFLQCQTNSKSAAAKSDTNTLQEALKNRKLKVTTTTTFLTDLLLQIGGKDVELKGLMGSGVDPHLYKASAGDIQKIKGADVLFYNGLHLEGKLEAIFEKLENQHHNIFAVGSVIPKSKLLESENFASNYDPHIWFNIDYWSSITQFVADKLSKLDPNNQVKYQKRATTYQQKLQALKSEIITSINSLPQEKRVLVTAHDAFNYFGAAYNFEVVGLQGLSTVTEAGVKDVQKLSKLIIDRKVKAIFAETSVSKKTIIALKEAVKSKGWEVTLGEALFSDALGVSGTATGDYIGMYKHNVSAIITALK